MENLATAELELNKKIIFMCELWEDWDHYVFLIDINTPIFKDPFAKWNTRADELFCGDGTAFMISDLHFHCLHLMKSCCYPKIYIHNILYVYASQMLRKIIKV